MIVTRSRKAQRANLAEHPLPEPSSPTSCAWRVGGPLDETAPPLPQAQSCVHTRRRSSGKRPPCAGSGGDSCGKPDHNFCIWNEIVELASSAGTLPTQKL